MKRAVSVSLGSSARDKRAEIDLLGERVVVERIGTDGDTDRAARLFSQLDGKVDALGVGGIDLWVGSAERRFPLRSGHRLIQGVKATPVVDGEGIRNTVERQSMSFVEKEIGSEIQPKRAMLTGGFERYGMSLAVTEAGYETAFCDLMFSVGIPIALRTLRQLNIAAFFLAPIISRLPISILYPTGDMQHETVPKFTHWYNWATLIAGDCLYVKRHMPPALKGKVVLTNTTTEEDLSIFQRAGVRYLVTTTPRLDGRSFGTNMMEAALVAAAGKGRPLSPDELETIVDQLHLRPHIQRLNE